VAPEYAPVPPVNVNVPESECAPFDVEHVLPLMVAFSLLPVEVVVSTIVPETEPQFRLFE
jgi:hypothetical protein